MSKILQADHAAADANDSRAIDNTWTFSSKIAELKMKIAEVLLATPESVSIQSNEPACINLLAAFQNVYTYVLASDCS